MSLTFLLPEYILHFDRTCSMTLLQYLILLFFYIFSGSNLTHDPVSRSMSARHDNELSGINNTTARLNAQDSIMTKDFQNPIALTIRRPPCPPPKLPYSKECVPQRPPRQQSIYESF